MWQICIKYTHTFHAKFVSIILLCLCLHQVNKEAWKNFRKWYTLLRTNIAQELTQKKILSLCCFSEKKTRHYFLPFVTVLFVSSTLLHQTGLKPVFYFNFLYYHADIVFFRARMFNILSYKTKDFLISYCLESLEKWCKHCKWSFPSFRLAKAHMTLKYSVFISFSAVLLKNLFVPHISCWQ